MDANRVYIRDMYPRDDVERNIYLSGLVVGDSRLWRTDSFEWGDVNLNKVTLIPIRGGNTTHIQSYIVNWLDQRASNERSTIKICIGVNDILSGISPSVVVDSLMQIKRHILRHYNYVLVSLAEIAPVDLNKWNLRHSSVLTDTQANNRITAANDLIKRENAVIYRPFLRPAATPFLTHALIRRKRVEIRGVVKTIISFQKSVLYDGLHANNVCKKRWVTSIKRALNIDIPVLLSVE